MNVKTYNEIMDALNFYDSSVGLYQINFSDEIQLTEIVESFNYEALGYKDTLGCTVFLFKDNKNTYAISEELGQLNVYEYHIF